MAKRKRQDHAVGTTLPKPKCGIVMPLSPIDNCDEEHWDDVRQILFDAVGSADFDPDMVSNADEVGIIQGRIIQNLYSNPIVVCDVSGKNPNVMFELGIRLAFDKPTVIVKDDKTSYSFDTSPIEHLPYPRDLRYAAIVEFKKSLAAKIKATHEKATKTEGFSTFLKHFGQFSVSKLDEKELASSADVADELSEMREAIAELAAESKRVRRSGLGSVAVDPIAEAIFRAVSQDHVSRRTIGEPDYREHVRHRVERELGDDSLFNSAADFRRAFDEGWNRLRKTGILLRACRR